MSIKDVFDNYASNYDATRKILIPCFDDFYGIAINTIPFQTDQPIKVLDLGAGTGIMAGFVASQFPNASIDLMDVAEKMLFEAKKRLECYPNDFRFLVSDYSKEGALENHYDVIMSSLSIHHLSDPEKQDLFKTIYTHLNRGGIFINADQVSGDTKNIDEIYRKTWIKQIKENGISEEEMNQAFERMQEDQMSPLMPQLSWLTYAGFSTVNCWYKNYSFVVYSGTR